MTVDRIASGVRALHASPAAALLVAALTLSCQKASSEPQLPPASGPGAAPLPALPVIEKAGATATAVTPTGGRTTGTTVPRSEAQIGPNGQGVIVKINVKEGDRVRRGMVLFRLDARDAELRVAQVQTALAAAKVNLGATEVEHRRTKALFDEKAVNLAQWEQMQARLDGAKVGIQQAEVAVNMAQKALDDTVVRSPVSGIVTAKLKNEGEMATMMPPTVVLVVQDQSVLELRFRLPESALARVRAGDVLTARFESLGIEARAKVVRIQPAVDPMTRTVEYVAEIPNADAALRPGLLADVAVGAAAAPVAAGQVAPGAARRPSRAP